MDPGVELRDNGTSIRPPEGGHSVTGRQKGGKAWIPGITNPAMKWRDKFRDDRGGND